MKVLYIMSSYNIYGGTPKKTLDLLRYSNNDCFIYMFEDGYNEFKYLFEETGALITEGHYGRNFFKHLSVLLKLIDENEIQILQTQFTFGEVLGYLVKCFRPHIKLTVAFVTPFEPSYFKKHIVNFAYKKVDAFVYVSKYVKKYKTDQFPILNSKYSKIIYNGTETRKITDDNFPKMKSLSLLDVAGLVDWKNIDVLVEALNIIVNTKKIENIYLYIAGDGPERNNLEKKIKDYSLGNNIFLMGYQKNIGALLNSCDIFVHPAYAEGFGIAIAEAMFAEKPIIVADAGALPELIENEKSGLVVEATNAQAWVEAILDLINNKDYANNLAISAKKRAEQTFSIKSYVKNYEELYLKLMVEK